MAEPVLYGLCLGLAARKTPLERLSLESIRVQDEGWKLQELLSSNVKELCTRN